jgi:citronellol/citronellal dehydrogenase
MIAPMPDEARSRVFAPRLLHGRVALVTGGGTGLGMATAIELARCGAQVTIAGRRAQTLEAAALEIARAVGAGPGEATEEVASETGERGDAGAIATGGGLGLDVAAGASPVDWMAGDVREPSDARRLIEGVLERRGGLDILVNNAGGQYFTPAEGIVAKGWSAVWRLNVEGMLNMSEAAVEHGLGAASTVQAGEGALGGPVEGAGEGLPIGGTGSGPMGGAGGGTIVNVTLSPHHGMPGMAHSGAARATVEALTRELAARWADRGIAVTAVAAGHFDTDAMSKYPDTVRSGMARSVPLQRLGRPEEHAWLVALLCSPLGRALNGSTVTLDGARDNWFGPWPPPGLAGETGEVPTEARRGPGR